MMALVNDIVKTGSINRAEYHTLLMLLNPFVPHITEELNERCGLSGELAHEAWPVYDEAKCVDSSVEMPVQINGKLRGRITVPTDSDNETVLTAAKQDEKVAAALEGKTLIKEIVVKNKLVNLVVKG